MTLTAPPTAAVTGRDTARISRLRAQLGFELRFLLLRGENLLVNLLIPAGALLAFGSLGSPPEGYDKSVDFLMLGVIALGMIGAGMVSMGVSTGYERHYHVLKRLGATPLGRGELLLAKAGSIFVIQLVQVVLLALLATVFLDWSLPGRVWLAVPVLLAGSLCFASIGFLLAGRLSAEANMALNNVLFIAFIALGGMLTPLDRLPSLVERLASLLPGAAVTDCLRAVLAHGEVPALTDVAVVVVWTAVCAVAAARTFRWD